MALLFALNYDKCYYICWNTYRRIDGFFRTAPGHFGRAFYFAKKSKFLYKKC